jgi:hypothetical protein
MSSDHKYFKFDIDDIVTITASGERAEVVGRAEYRNAENQYYLYYKAADGRAVEAWWAESRLEIIPGQR